MTDPAKDAQDKAFRQAQDKGLISFEKYDAQAELDKLSALMIKQVKLACLIYVLLLPHHIVPVFDGWYVQHQDRPALPSEGRGFSRDKYLVQEKTLCLN